MLKYADLLYYFCREIHIMKRIYWIGFLLLESFMFLGCRAVHLGVGPGYNSGNSGGCNSKTEMGIHLQSAVYTKQKSGPGISIRLFTPGYTDCNDSDPLFFLNSQLEYRQFFHNDRWAINLGAGYATGVFVDEGYSYSGGITYYPGSRFFFKAEQQFYRAFHSKMNAFKPGISSNSSSQLSIGICF